ncbi:ABC transporter ATP-binding protein [Rhodoligotrophos defluvii]|uniref:ABC transporter ATP-binding protein n=1 Tax=Rhodoligotrophos defluvii TaxID=2561934 RepID=UPI0010C93C20|nr:ABC transporter ATP-binding protein [Rhodoligotrophos defluvii]
MSSPVLSVEGLTVDFWNGTGWTEVVRDVSFALFPGETLGVAGESGCGKSTVAYALMGETRRGSRIRAGRVLLGGEDLLALPPKQLQAVRGKRVSLVPQNPVANLTPSMSVGRQLAETMAAHGVGADGTMRTRLVELLEAVGLPDPASALSRYPHQFSGGQQQRIMIAMALACRPELIVLDEPTTGLDVTTQNRILALFSHLRAETGVALLYVSHDLAALSQISDRIAVMYAGEMVEVGATSDIFARPLHPYTKGLIASVPRLDAPDAKDIRLTGSLRRAELPEGCRFSPRCPFAIDSCWPTRQVLSPVHGLRRRVACQLWPQIEAGHG